VPVAVTIAATTLRRIANLLIISPPTGLATAALPATLTASGHGKMPDANQYFGQIMEELLEGATAP
jgi:hypothetical protein